MIPNSDSYCQSLFLYSTGRKICTDGHHKLGRDATQGNTSTSVCTETTSIRNNLLGILIPKINIFGKKKLACYEWELTKSIRAQAKSSHTKTFRLRKNNNNKQKLVRTQKTEL